jgi:hypothetical protein
MEKFEIVKAKDDFAKRLEAIKKVINYDNLKVQINYKLITISIMITTINLVYPLGNLNLLFGYGVMIYFMIILMYRKVKKTLLNKKHLMDFNYLFDCYCVLCLLSIFKEILSYAV